MSPKKSTQQTTSEFVAVMGPSGLGKSPMLTVLGAMNPPGRARATVDGVTSTIWTSSARLAFATNISALSSSSCDCCPTSRLRRMSCFPWPLPGCPRPRNWPGRGRRWPRWGWQEERPSYQLSGGKQGRVAVARAIVNRPPLLLADEPTGNLDRATREQVLALLSELNRAGQTVIMVSHDPEAAAYASRTVRILDGQIVEEQPARGCR